MKNLVMSRQTTKLQIRLHMSLYSLVGIIVQSGRHHCLISLCVAERAMLSHNWLDML